MFKHSKTHLVGCIVTMVICIADMVVSLNYGIPSFRERHSRWSLEPPPSSSILGKFANAAASSAGVPCAEVAINVLKINGTAADAVIAGMFCVGVVNTNSMGLGGGFLMTYYDRASGKAYSLNSREVAPAAAHKDMFSGDSKLSTIGGLAVGVPGEARGYYELYKTFGGNVPWADLIKPSLRLCEQGYPVSSSLALRLNRTRDIILNQPSMSVFVNPDTGDVYQDGDLLKRPQLAQTLRALQEDPDALYTGKLAPKLAQDIRNLGGIITVDDLRNYKPVWKDAVEVSLAGGDIRMFSVPPPGSGLVLGFILNILDGYNFTSRSLSEDTCEVLTHHRIAEAMKWAYARRTELGDADFVDVSELQNMMTSDNFAACTRAEILDGETFQDPGHYGAVTTNTDDHGTSHFSLLAPNGDAVSMTSTINLAFGAKIRSVQTGIVLNNEMDDFSAPNIINSFGIPPSPANFIEPGKRPLSSMSPSVFVDAKGDVVLVVGAAGGTRITSSVAWVALRKLFLGQDIKQAIDARRTHHQLLPMTLFYQEGTSKNVVAGVEKIGHVTQQYSVAYSAVTGVARSSDHRSIEANSDFRSGGHVDGF